MLRILSRSAGVYSQFRDTYQKPALTWERAFARNRHQWYRYLQYLKCCVINKPQIRTKKKNSELLGRSDSMAAWKTTDSLIVLFVTCSLSIAGLNSPELSGPCEKKSKKKKTCNMRSPLFFMTTGFGYFLSLYIVYCTGMCLPWPIAIPMSSKVLIACMFKIHCIQIE